MRKVIKNTMDCHYLQGLLIILVMLVMLVMVPLPSAYANYDVTIESIELEKPLVRDENERDPTKEYLKETDIENFSSKGYSIEKIDATIEGSINPMIIDADDRDISIIGRFTLPGIFFIRPYQNSTLQSLDGRELLNTACCLNLAEPGLSYTHTTPGDSHTFSSTYNLDWEKLTTNEASSTFNSIVDIYFYSEY